MCLVVFVHIEINSFDLCPARSKVGTADSSEGPGEVKTQMNLRMISQRASERTPLLMDFDQMTRAHCCSELEGM